MLVLFALTQIDARLVASEWSRSGAQRGAQRNALLRPFRKAFLPWYGVRAPMAAAAAAASGEGDHAIAREEIAALDAAIAQVEDRIAALQQQRSDLVRQREVARGNAADALLAVRETDWTRQFPWSKEVERVKCEVFGLHGPWRANQREAINVVLSGHDCMLIMRSGGGKSLTFQVRARAVRCRRCGR